MQEFAVKSARPALNKPETHSGTELEVQRKPVFQLKPRPAAPSQKLSINTWPDKTALV